MFAKLDHITKILFMFNILGSLYSFISVYQKQWFSFKSFKNNVGFIWAHFFSVLFDMFFYFIFFTATTLFPTDPQKEEVKEGARNTAALEAVGPTTPQFSEGLSLLHEDTWMEIDRLI